MLAQALLCRSTGHFQRPRLGQRPSGRLREGEEREAVENGIVASKPQEFRPQPPTIRLVTGYVSMRCGMLRVNDDTFTMISGLIVIAVGCIAGLLALG
jgi:hypothetical protein